MFCYVFAVEINIKVLRNRRNRFLIFSGLIKAAKYQFMLNSYVKFFTFQSLSKSILEKQSLFILHSWNSTRNFWYRRLCSVSCIGFFSPTKTPRITTTYFLPFWMSCWRQCFLSSGKGKVLPLLIHGEDCIYLMVKVIYRFLPW